METKKKDKKKLLVLLLLLVAVVGITGYGVYSYYWTQGNFSQNDASNSDDYNVIKIDGSYDPRTGDSSSSANEFLGNGGTVVLTCPEKSNGKETITCTGTIWVANYGSTEIDVEVLDAHGYADSSSSDVTVTAGNPTFDWTKTSLSSGGGSELKISVPVTINNGTTGGLDSDEPEEVHAPVGGGTVSASVDFRLKSTQRHD